MAMRRYFLWGMCWALGAPLVMAIVFAIVLGSSYDGKCGGFFPGLAPAAPCSLWAYMAGDVLLFALLFWNVYWPLVVALLALPALAGYLLDRRGKHRAA
jgi:hypothetical protein